MIAIEKRDFKLYLMTRQKREKNTGLLYWYNTVFAAENINYRKWYYVDKYIKKSYDK